MTSAKPTTTAIAALSAASATLLDLTKTLSSAQPASHGGASKMANGFLGASIGPDDVIAQVNADLARLSSFGPALTAPAQQLTALNVPSLLPDHCDQAQAGLKSISDAVAQLFIGLSSYVTDLSNDTASLQSQAQALGSQEAGIQAQINDTQGQIADLQSQINDAEERQSEESSIPIFGGLISELDGLIDDLVNQTNAKAGEINDLEGQLAGMSSEAATLAAQNARISAVTPSLTAVLGLTNQLSAVASDLVSKITAVGLAVQDSAGLPPLIAAATTDYNTALQWCAQLAGTQLPST